MNAGVQRLYSRYGPRLRQTARASAKAPRPEAIEGFRQAQRLAYACVTSVAAELRPGMTEREAARMLAADSAARGARMFLHRPFAWFGEHSRFAPYGGDFHAYHPSDKRLEEGAPYILDVSPVVDGYMGDVGYAVFPTETADHVEAKRFLLRLREDLPKLFESELSIADIWHAVDARTKDAGYETCHALYPFRVLGHRVYRLGPLLRNLTPRIVPMALMGTDWFSIQTLAKFAGHGFVSELLTPENRGSKVGFWAIEPHVGKDVFGVKFEEILAVEPSGRAFWIDDETPHVKEGRARGWV